MQVVYATGQPRLLEFAVGDKRQTVPNDAIIFAICDGDRLVSQLDEYLFNAITDEEYYTYIALLRDAEKHEKEQHRNRRGRATMRRFINWLSGIVTGESAAIHQSGG